MRTITTVFVVLTLLATPVAAAPSADVEQPGPTITARLVGVLAAVWAKLGAGWDPHAAKLGEMPDPDGAPAKDGSDDGDKDPPLDGLGAGPDPFG